MLSLYLFQSRIQLALISNNLTLWKRLTYKFSHDGKMELKRDIRDEDLKEILLVTFVLHFFFTYNKLRDLRCRADLQLVGRVSRPLIIDMIWARI